MKSLKKFLIIFFACVGFLLIVGLICSLTMNEKEELVEEGQEEVVDNPTPPVIESTGIDLDTDSIIFEP